MAGTSRERSGPLGVAGGFPLDRFLSFHRFHLLLKHPSKIVGFGFSHQICKFDLPPPELHGAWGWSVPAALAGPVFEEAKQSLVCPVESAGDKLLGTCNHPTWSLEIPPG